jgi:hypothetical protein
MHHLPSPFRLILASAILLGFYLSAGSAVAGQAADTDQVTLCHATGSDTNPYEEITIDAAGAFNGHYGEGNGNHQNAEDIIPPFTYQGQEYEQNYDAEGQAILEAGCEVDEPGEPVEEVPDTGSGTAADGANDAVLLAGMALLLTMAGVSMRFISQRSR